MKNMNMNQFLDGLASEAPAPGGGSVAALCGALSSALISMVANLTIGKEKYKENWEQMEDVKKEAEALRATFSDLMEKDVQAFNRLMEVIKMPKTTEDEQKLRADAMEKALKECTIVPLLTLENCSKVAYLARTAAEFGNPNVATDAGAAAALAEATAKISSFNVRVNLSAIKDRMFAYDCTTKASSIVEAVKHDYAVIERGILKKIN